MRSVFQNACDDEKQKPHALQRKAAGHTGPPPAYLPCRLANNSSTNDLLVDWVKCESEELRRLHVRVMMCGREKTGFDKHNIAEEEE